MKYFVIFSLMSACLGCARRADPTPELKPVPKPSSIQEVNQVPDARLAKIAVLERKLEELEAARRTQDEADEEQMEERIAARHPDWTPEKKKQQLGLLEWKWFSANQSEVEDAVKEMKAFASLVSRSELTDEDYRDKYRHEWLGSPERKALSKAIGETTGQLDKLK